MFTNLPQGCKVIPDEKLDRPAQIEFRIAQLKRTNNGILTPALASRIARLKARLPQAPGQPVKPGIPYWPSKQEVEEFSSSAAVLV